MTKDEKDKIMKQLLADAGYDYEPKPRKDRDEKPSGEDEDEGVDLGSICIKGEKYGK